MVARIPIAGPSITSKEIDYVTEAVKTAWYGDANVFHARFEAAFAAHCGRKYAVSLPSCTSALHLALAALGVGEGDEVIVPDATWIASVAPVRYVGATPVFADIDRRLVVPVTGRLCCRDPRRAPRRRSWSTSTARCPIGTGWRRLPQPVVSPSSRTRRKPSVRVGATSPPGLFGAMSAFSFHGSKTLTTGEGGMLVLDDDRLLAPRAATARPRPRPPGDRMFFNAEVGFKIQDSAMQAALGLAQLERLDESRFLPSGRSSPGTARPLPAGTGASSIPTSTACSIPTG